MRELLLEAAAAVDDDLVAIGVVQLGDVGWSVCVVEPGDLREQCLVRGQRGVFVEDVVPERIDHLDEVIAERLGVVVFGPRCQDTVTLSVRAIIPDATIGELDLPVIARVVPGVHPGVALEGLLEAFPVHIVCARVVDEHELRAAVSCHQVCGGVAWVPTRRHPLDRGHLHRPTDPHNARRR